LRRHSSLALAAIVAALVIAPAGLAAPPPSGVGSGGHHVYAASWHYVHFHMNGYGGANGVYSDPHNVPYTCGHAVSSDPTGGCHAWGENGPNAYPFNTTVKWIWGKPYNQNPCPESNIPAGYARHLRLATVYKNPNDHLCGWTDGGWATYAIHSGSIDGHPVEATGQTISQRETRGGPLFVHYGYDRGSGGSPGYVLGLRGWLYY